MDVHTPATVGVGFTSYVKQAVNQVEHRAVLRIKHVNDIVVGLIKLLIPSRCVDEHLTLMVELLRLHREFLHTFKLRLHSNGECKSEQYGDDDMLVHI